MYSIETKTSKHLKIDTGKNLGYSTNFKGLEATEDLSIVLKFLPSFPEKNHFLKGTFWPLQGD